MKFVGLRKFSGKTLEQLLKYVGVEMGKALTDLYVGLSNLTIADNFSKTTANRTLVKGWLDGVDHFIEEDVVFAASSNTSFVNQLKTASVVWMPLRISYDGTDAATPVIRMLMESAAAPITANNIILRNPSASESITATILVMRR